MGSRHLESFVKQYMFERKRAALYFVLIERVLLKRFNWCRDDNNNCFRHDHRHVDRNRELRIRWIDGVQLIVR